MIAGKPETRQIEPAFFEKLGRFITSWAIIEYRLATMLAACLQADPGMTLLLVQSVSAATVSGWVRTMSRFGDNPEESLTELEEILNEVDELRAERNALVHGLWATDVSDAGTVLVQTIRLHATQPARQRLITLADLGELIDLTLRLSERLHTFLIAHGLETPD